MRNLATLQNSWQIWTFDCLNWIHHEKIVDFAKRNLEIGWMVSEIWSNECLQGCQVKLPNMAKWQPCKNRMRYRKSGFRFWFGMKKSVRTDITLVCSLLEIDCTVKITLKHSPKTRHFRHFLTFSVGYLGNRQSDFHKFFFGFFVFLFSTEEIESKIKSF